MDIKELRKLLREELARSKIQEIGDEDKTPRARYVSDPDKTRIVPGIGDVKQSPGETTEVPPETPRESKPKYSFGMMLNMALSDEDLSPQAKQTLEKIKRTLLQINDQDFSIITSETIKNKKASFDTLTLLNEITKILESLRVSELKR